MSAALAIAAREIRERRVLLAAALAVGLLPALAWYLPGMREQENAELVAMFVGLAFPAAAALAVGTSIIGRDLAEGRLAFYLARPISELSLWAGKFLGGYALVGMAFVLVVAPFNVVSGNVRHWVADGRIPFQLIVAAAFLLVLMTGAHAAASFYRSRSAWIVADILLFGLVLAICQRLMVRMLDAGAGEIMVDHFPLVFAGGAAVALLASAVQLLVGRADPARGRRALSWTLWLGAGLYVLGLHAASSWVLGTTPAETGVSYGCRAAPRGAGLVFWGGASGRAGYRPIFAMDASSGAFASFSAERGGMALFTEDGRRALWTADAANLAVERRPALVTASFDSSGPHIDEVPLDGFEGAPQLLALDPAGGRALVARSGRVAVLDTSSGAAIANLGGVDVGAGAFLPAGGIRLLANRAGIVVLDWNPRDGSTLERMRVAAAGAQAGLFGVRDDLALVSPDGRDLVLLDLAAGRQTTLSRAPQHRRTHAFGAQAIGLAQGGVAIGLGNRLWIVSPAGEVAGHVELDASVGILGLSQVKPDELAIGVMRPPGTLFLEIPSGVVRREAKGIRPAADWFRRVSASVKPGSLGSRLFVTEDDALVELLADGQRRVIVPAVADE